MRGKIVQASASGSVVTLNDGARAIKGKIIDDRIVVNLNEASAKSEFDEDGIKRTALELPIRKAYSMV